MYSFHVQYKFIFILLLQYQAMQSFNKQRTLSKTGSTVSFAEKLATPDTTCQHSLYDNRQGITLTFGCPMNDETTISLRSNSRNKKIETNQHLQNSRYTDVPKFQITQYGKSNYQQLQMTLKNENKNLKQQNQLLLQEIHKLKTNNKKYKEACHQKQLELKQIRQLCQNHKKRGDEIMTTIMAKMLILEQKIKKEELSQSSCSLLDILNQAEQRLT